MSLYFSVRFGVSLSSGSSPKGSVRNGMQGCGSAKEDEDEEEKNRISIQTATSPKYPTPQTRESKFYTKLPLMKHILSCPCVPVTPLHVSDGTHVETDF